MSTRLMVRREAIACADSLNRSFRFLAAAEEWIIFQLNAALVGQGGSHGAVQMAEQRSA